MHRTLFAAALIAAVLTAGCTATGGQGELEILVSDQPAAIDDFSSLTVTFTEARVFPGENVTNDSTDHITFELDGEVYDLTTLQGASARSLVNGTLDAGTYGKIELHVQSATGVVDGESVAVQVPSEKLMLTAPFTIAPNETTRFVFDMHVVETGTGRYVLRPVISESGVVGEDVGEPEPPTTGGNGTSADAAP